MSSDADIEAIFDEKMKDNRPVLKDETLYFSDKIRRFHSD